MAHKHFTTNNHNHMQTKRISSVPQIKMIVGIVVPLFLFHPKNILDIRSNHFQVLKYLIYHWSDDPVVHFLDYCETCVLKHSMTLQQATNFHIRVQRAGWPLIMSLEAGRPIKLFGDRGNVDIQGQNAH